MGNEIDANAEVDREVEHARDALLKRPSAVLVLKNYKWQLKQGFIRWVKAEVLRCNRIISRISDLDCA